MSEAETKLGPKPINKIALPEEVLNQAQATHKELKERGANIKLDDLLSEAMLAITDEYWDRQLDRFTPDEYLLMTVVQNPEARRLMVEKAKKVLDLLKRGEPIQKVGKKRGPKTQNNDLVETIP